MHLGDAAMWLACASVLASFDIRSPEDGKPILPNPRFVDGSITCVTFVSTRGLRHAHHVIFRVYPVIQSILSVQSVPDLDFHSPLVSTLR